MILKMCFSVNQIDDLQSSNKRQSWTLRLPCLCLFKHFSPVKTFGQQSLPRNICIRYILFESKFISRNHILASMTKIAFFNNSSIFQEHFFSLHFSKSCPDFYILKIKLRFPFFSGWLRTTFAKLTKKIVPGKKIYYEKTPF